METPTNIHVNLPRYLSLDLKKHKSTSESMTKRQKEHISVRFRVSPAPILHMTHNNRGARTFQHTVPPVFLFSWELLTFSPLYKTMQKTTFMAIHFASIVTHKLKDGFAKAYLYVLTWYIKDIIVILTV